RSVSMLVTILLSKSDIANLVSIKVVLCGRAIPSLCAGQAKTRFCSTTYEKIQREIGAVASVRFWHKRTWPSAPLADRGRTLDWSDVSLKPFTQIVCVCLIVDKGGKIVRDFIFREWFQP